MAGRFEFYNMTLGGMPYGEPVSCTTSTGVFLQCDPRMDATSVRHMCEVARKTPHYPCDLCAWSGPANDRRMVWTARIYWRE